MQMRSMRPGARARVHAYASAVSLALRLTALLVALISCRFLQPEPAAPTPPQQPTPRLYQQVTLTPVASSEQGQPYSYTITLQIPALIGSDDPRVQAFNANMLSIATSAAEEFKRNLTNLPPTPVSAASSFDVRYALLSPPGDIFSIKFEMQGYVTGAAHPYHVSRTSNFDLQQGRELSLAELFMPGASFLDAISRYCIGQLKLRDIAFDETVTGADSTAENYRNWNVTSDGLLITFEEYQVAAYAAGPQLVLIPYDQLRPLIANPGPLTPYLP
jgi:uncharacterized protein DUF3298